MMNPTLIIPPPRDYQDPAGGGEHPDLQEIPRLSFVSKSAATSNEIKYNQNVTPRTYHSDENIEELYVSNKPIFKDQRHKPFTVKVKSRRFRYGGNRHLSNRSRIWGDFKRASETESRASTFKFHKNELHSSKEELLSEGIYTSSHSQEHCKLTRSQRPLLTCSGDDVPLEPSPTWSYPEIPSTSSRIDNAAHLITNQRKALHHSDRHDLLAASGYNSRRLEKISSITKQDIGVGSDHFVRPVAYSLANKQVQTDPDSDQSSVAGTQETVVTSQVSNSVSTPQYVNILRQMDSLLLCQQNSSPRSTQIPRQHFTNPLPHCPMPIMYVPEMPSQQYPTLQPLHPNVPSYHCHWQPLNSHLYQNHFPTVPSMASLGQPPLLPRKIKQTDPDFHTDYSPPTAPTHLTDSKHDILENDHSTQGIHKLGSKLSSNKGRMDVFQRLYNNAKTLRTRKNADKQSGVNNPPHKPPFQQNSHLSQELVGRNGKSQIKKKQKNSHCSNLAESRKAPRFHPKRRHKFPSSRRPSNPLHQLSNIEHREAERYRICRSQFRHNNGFTNGIHNQFPGIAGGGLYDTNPYNPSNFNYGISNW